MKENNICKNCKHYSQGFLYDTCNIGVCQIVVKYEGNTEERVSGDFGCISFKEKDGC